MLAISGWEYLDKLVQIPFCLPDPPPAKVQRLIGSCLQGAECTVSTVAERINTLVEELCVLSGGNRTKMSFGSKCLVLSFPPHDDESVLLGKDFVEKLNKAKTHEDQVLAAAQILTARTLKAANAVKTLGPEGMEITCRRINEALYDMQVLLVADLELNTLPGKLQDHLGTSREGKPSSSESRVEPDLAGQYDTTRDAQNNDSSSGNEVAITVRARENQQTWKETADTIGRQEKEDAVGVLEQHEHEDVEMGGELMQEPGQVKKTTQKGRKTQKDSEGGEPSGNKQPPPKGSKIEEDAKAISTLQEPGQVKKTTQKGRKTQKDSEGAEPSGNKQPPPKGRKTEEDAKAISTWRTRCADHSRSIYGARMPVLLTSAFQALGAQMPAMLTAEETPNFEFLILAIVSHVSWFL